jgi:ABC-2 type transport system ATP-binding protein
MQKVLEIIRHDVDADRVRVDVPTQNLESYFLSVVQKARQNEQQTSGATSGSHVAAYLAGQQTAPQADKVLERLAMPTPAPEPVHVVTPAAEPAVQVEKLEALAKATPPPPTAVPAPEKPVEKAAPVDLKKADEKLASLLGKPK